MNKICIAKFKYVNSKCALMRLITESLEMITRQIPNAKAEEIMVWLLKSFALRKLVGVTVIPSHAPRLVIAMLNIPR